MCTHNCEVHHNSTPTPYGGRGIPYGYLASAYIVQNHEVLQAERSVYTGVYSMMHVASFPGPHAERGSGPGDTWQNSHICCGQQS